MTVRAQSNNKALKASKPAASGAAAASRIAPSVSFTRSRKARMAGVYVPVSARFFIRTTNRAVLKSAASVPALRSCR